MIRKQTTFVKIGTTDPLIMSAKKIPLRGHLIEKLGKTTKGWHIKSLTISY